MKAERGRLWRRSPAGSRPSPSASPWRWRSCPSGRPRAPRLPSSTSGSSGGSRPAERLLLAPGRPVASLTVESDEFEDAYRHFGEATAGWLKAQRNAAPRPAAPGGAAAGHAVGPGAQSGVHARRAPLGHLLGERGRPALPAHRSRPVRAPGRKVRQPSWWRRASRSAPAVRGTLAGGLPPGRCGTSRRRTVSPPQSLLIGVTPPQEVFACRAAGWIGAPGSRPDESFGKTLLSGLFWLPVALAIVGIFLTLLLRARIDLVNGALLALLALLSASPRWLLRFLAASPWMVAIGWLLGAPGRALAILLTWSAGESLLRAVRPDFTTSLDTLRRGRLGPRAAGLLLAGCRGGRRARRPVARRLRPRRRPARRLSGRVERRRCPLPPRRQPARGRHLVAAGDGPGAGARHCASCPPALALGGRAPRRLRRRPAQTSSPTPWSWRRTSRSPACWSGSAGASG